MSEPTCRWMMVDEFDDDYTILFLVNVWLHLMLFEDMFTIALILNSSKLIFIIISFLNKFIKCLVNLNYEIIIF